MTRKGLRIEEGLLNNFMIHPTHYLMVCFSQGDKAKGPIDAPAPPEMRGCMYGEGTNRQVVTRLSRDQDEQLPLPADTAELFLIASSLRSHDNLMLNPFHYSIHLKLHISNHSQ